MDEITYVVVSPGGYYADACQRKGFCKVGQHLVVSFTAWNKWYSEARFSRLPVTPPQPAFCGDNYEIAKSVADDLNEWKADNANISTIC